ISNHNADAIKRKDNQYKRKHAVQSPTILIAKADRTLSIPPLYKNIISPKPLCTRRILQLGCKPRLVRQQSRMRNHDPVINAEPLISRIDAPTSISRHNSHHLLQTLVAAHPTYNEDFFRS